MKIDYSKGERGSQKPKLLGKYGAKLEIPDGLGEFDLKNHPWERYGNFMEPHIKTYKISVNGKNLYRSTVLVNQKVR